MFGLTIPFAIEATRRNPVRTAVRNLAMSQGDDIRLAITVYAQDGTTIDVTAGVVTASIQREAWGHSSGSSRDYGLGWLTTSGGCVWSGLGVAVAGQNGAVVVSIPRSVTTAWWGRFRLHIAIDDVSGGCITAEGILDVRPCPQRPVYVPPPVVLPPTIYGADFAISDFSSADFYTGTEIIASNVQSIGRIVDDFGTYLADDYGNHLAAV